MSGKSTLWACIAIGAATLIASAITYGPEARGGPVIPAGGKAGKIRSFKVEGSGVVVVAPSTPGPNGFIVTQIWINSGGATVGVLVDGVQVARPTASVTDIVGKIDLNPGVPAPAGSVLAVQSIGDGNSRHFTVLGYEY